MIDFDGKAILVTGAGSGIGRATAFELATRDARLFLVDRDREAVARTADLANHLGGSAEALVADVSDRDAMRELADFVHHEVGALDVLVNNAGVGAAGSFLETELDTFGWAIGVNLMGVIHGCHYFVPAMVERGRGGHVVNVASLAGLVPSKNLSVYGSTKFGVVGFSECLRAELHGHGIGVSTICPGIVNTAIVRTTRLSGARSEDERARLVSAYARRNYGPEKVARAIVRAVERNRGLVPVAPEAHVLARLRRFVPAFTAWLARQDPPALRRAGDARA